MNNNLNSLAVEMILICLKQKKTVVMYGNGTSMNPTIQEGDALVVPLPSDLKIEDIVALLINPNHLVAHRIVDIGSRRGKTSVQTIGDNLVAPDPRRGIEFVKGKVIEIKRFEKCVTK